MTVNLDEIRAALPVLRHTAYLNTGTFGPLPCRAAEAMAAQQAAELEHGRSRLASFPALKALRERVRAGLAATIGARPEEIALTRATTDGCNVVLAGLRLGPDDEVVTTDLEHYGLLGALAASGARVRLARLHDRPSADALEAIASEVGPRTRLIALSHVSWVTGQVLPLAQLAELGPPVLADGAQGAGAVFTDVAALGCAFYTVSGQKWLLGPDATGGLYVHPNWIERLAVSFPSYFGQQAYEEDGTATPVAGAPRFDVGTLPAPALAGLEQSLAFAAEVGPTRFVAAREAATRCGERLGELVDVVPGAGEATLVSWRPAEPAAAQVARLGEAGVVVRDLPRWGWVRASVGWWTSDDDIERLVGALRST